MKSVGYVGAVVRLYRLALDWIAEQLFLGKTAEELVFPDAFRKELSKIGTRGQSENFFLGNPSSADMLYDRMRLEQNYVPVALVLDTAPLQVETRQVLHRGDQLEYLGRAIEPVQTQVVGIRLDDQTEVARANPGQKVTLQTEPPLPEAEKNAILRKQIDAP